MGYVQKVAARWMSRYAPTTDRCTLCGLPVLEHHSAIVEVTHQGTVIRKAVFYGLHALCGDDWARSEMKRLREVYRQQPDFDFVFRVEVVP